MKIKLDYPSPLRGTEKQQLSQLHSQLYRMTELLNLGFDSLSPQVNQVESPQSPKSIFNSIKRLICQSGEIIDSFYNSLLPRFQQLFPSLDSFRQLSADHDTDRQALENLVSACQEEISQTGEEFHQALSNFVELEDFTIRRWPDNYVELWGNLDIELSSHTLPIALESARCIPAGTVSHSTLSTEKGQGSIYIFGKEIR